MEASEQLLDKPPPGVLGGGAQAAHTGLWVETGDLRLSTLPQHCPEGLGGLSNQRARRSGRTCSPQEKLGGPRPVGA
jgi:hypothetical protein